MEPSPKRPRFDYNNDSNNKSLKTIMSLFMDYSTNNEENFEIMHLNKNIISFCNNIDLYVLSLTSKKDHNFFYSQIKHDFIHHNKLKKIVSNEFINYYTVILRQHTYTHPKCELYNTCGNSIINSCNILCDFIKDKIINIQNTHDGIIYNNDTLYILTHIVNLFDLLLYKFNPIVHLAAFTDSNTVKYFNNFLDTLTIFEWKLILLTAAYFGNTNVYDYYYEKYGFNFEESFIYLLTYVSCLSGNIDFISYSHLKFFNYDISYCIYFIILSDNYDTFTYFYDKFEKTKNHEYDDSSEKYIDLYLIALHSGNLQIMKYIDNNPFFGYNFIVTESHSGFGEEYGIALFVAAFYADTETIDYIMNLYFHNSTKENCSLYNDKFIDDIDQEFICFCILYRDIEFIKHIFNIFDGCTIFDEYIECANTNGNQDIINFIISKRRI
jgi:hypothetical protein